MTSLPPTAARMRRRFACAGAVGALALVAAVGVASSALADVRVVRADLSGTQLRLEGTALPNRTITVNDVALGTSNGAGAFKVQSSTFDHGTSCLIQANDGSATSTPVSLTGCSTATTPTPGATGWVGIIPGGNGHGVITSTPAGINCILAASGVTGPCAAFFPAGTVVRLSVRANADSSFQGWRGLPGCSDASKVTIFAAVNIYCQPGLRLNF
jgi:hypothetical protein